MTAIARLTLLLIVATFGSNSTRAQQSERFGPYELHYSVVNTTFLAPEVAATYGIVRGEQRAILTLAVREHLADGGNQARTMQLQGRTWDLIQKSEALDFLEIREGQSVYYVAEFKFINEDWRFFEVDFRPDGARETYTFKLKHQLYIEQ
ncbi:MAG: DUF4426 domain-containing protein [Pseudomonadales bacterium]|nr:DUF4426 domain-containing protein [Halioglobus sp.]MCP5121307.1 DUF4426 domain-containing protein [Pseudomonadales bacterium]MCP5193353.1 DUF4426 domain-containing protein [Pseudomonadales bacterium]